MDRMSSAARSCRKRISSTRNSGACTGRCASRAERSAWCAWLVAVRVVERERLLAAWLIDNFSLCPDIEARPVCCDYPALQGVSNSL
jgi:hypothetical protein